ncbi:MAG: hypothetical protein HY962_00185 [Ignavibacteriae bacterium]|nr:hypothetical protein [Ignavibacteriota bacterium]
MSDTNYLIPLFWDQPQFRDAEKLRQVLLSGDASLRRWILLRFLQYARVKETFVWFTLDEIREVVPDLPARSADRKKWERLLEVYGSARG